MLALLAVKMQSRRENSKGKRAQRYGITQHSEVKQRMIVSYYCQSYRARFIWSPSDGQLTIRGTHEAECG